MFSTIVIIFREVLEIALILGVLLAATRDLTSRGKWVWTGITAGILGAVIVAIFAGRISEAVQGMGQEVFNALVLFLASILIGWTVIWMRRHARILTQHLKEVGRAVCEGKKPLYTLAVVIALAVLREGSEIVLFIAGIFASGQSILAIVTGSVAGLISGAMVGSAIYYGLIKISPRVFFSVTSWMLIFLAAGMVSQAVGFLQAGGFIPIFSSTLWDSSHIISENSFLGSFLHALIGYTDRPSGIQLISYMITLGGIAVILKSYGALPPAPANAANVKRVTMTALMVCVFFLGETHEILAAKKVYSPIVEGGELELEWRGSYDFDDRVAKDGKQKQKYAVGYGVTNRWFSELYGEIEKEPDKKFEFTALEWENRYQLFEQGQYWLDAGLYFAYETSFEDKHPDKIEGKFLLEKSLGNFSHTANVIFEKQVGRHPQEETEAGLAWSSRYHWREYLEPGFELHSDFGELREHIPYEEQTHQIGPVVYGRLGKEIKYDIGYLFGITDPAPEGTLKWILEYEWHF